MTEPSALELAEAGLRHAEGLTAKLSVPNWKPGRSDVEQARNSIAKLATALRAAPAQGEPVAWRMEQAIRRALESLCGDYPSMAADLRAALPSSPAPLSGSLNSGESEPPVTALAGAGETIFAECAEIAEGHVGNAGKVDEDATVLAGAVAAAYDEACRDIAKAIRDAHGADVDAATGTSDDQGGLAR